MIDIWKKCASFQTSEIHADQVRTIIKKGWFSDPEILELHQKINNEQDNNTVADASKINKQKHPNRNEPPTSESGNATQPNKTQPNNPKQTLSQKTIGKYRKLKKIMNSENTTFTIIEKHRMVNS